MCAARKSDDDKEKTDKVTRTEIKPDLRRLSVVELLAGDREIILVHGDAEYRLRITSNGRLILTK